MGVLFFGFAVANRSYLLLTYGYLCKILLSDFINDVKLYNDYIKN